MPLAEGVALQPLAGTFLIGVAAGEGAVPPAPPHDRRYAIDPSPISSELGWQPRHSFEEDWCRQLREQGGYSGGRLGVLAEEP